VLCEGSFADVVGGLGLAGVVAAGGLAGVVTAGAGAVCGADLAGALCGARLWLAFTVVPVFADVAVTLGLVATGELDVAGLLLVPPQPAISSATPIAGAASQPDLPGRLGLAPPLIVNFS
jgi:hypothetical protein